MQKEMNTRTKREGTVVGHTLHTSISPPQCGDMGHGCQSPHPIPNGGSNGGTIRASIVVWRSVANWKVLSNFILVHFSNFSATKGN